VQPVSKLHGFHANQHITVCPVTKSSVQLILEMLTYNCVVFILLPDNIYFDIRPHKVFLVLQVTWKWPGHQAFYFWSGNQSGKKRAYKATLILSLVCGAGQFSPTYLTHVNGCNQI